MTAVANTAFTAAQFNTYVRDNFLETAPSKATAAGGYFVTAGSNSIVERFWGTDYIETEESTTSTSYTNLSTVGPSVTVATSSRALVMIGARMRNNVAGQYCMASFELSGDTTRTAPDRYSVAFENTNQDGSTDIHTCQFTPLTDLTPGNNTFTMKYRTTTAGTAVFRFRRMAVIPF
jgi:hypothetical protein